MLCKSVTAEVEILTPVRAFMLLEEDLDTCFPMITNPTGAVYDTIKGRDPRSREHTHQVWILFIGLYWILTQMVPRPDFHRHQPKQCGHLTNAGVFCELHFDSHEKLNFKALQMGPVGINIYGAHCHSSNKMVKFLVIPNTCCSSMVGHYYLDLIEQWVTIRKSR
ncbi:hypothetical protein K438DRAFT_1749824 [Mycena galopus ATCC 62051]|nr:hypothetical protein K438DRAFT_1749824 [Mycena galopus ATCC 62051]